MLLGYRQFQLAQVCYFPSTMSKHQQHMIGRSRIGKTSATQRHKIHLQGRGGTPLYGLFRYVWPQRVWFFSPFGHKLGINYSHFAAILVINSILIFPLKSLIRFFLEEATSSSRPPSPIHALPSSSLLNACHAY